MKAFDRFSHVARLRPLAATLALASSPLAAYAADDTSAPTDPSSSQDWAIHAQATVVEQGTARFTSPYRGPNSLDPGTRGRETTDATLFVGLRPWRGAELWADPEIDQGFGLDNTLGVAGFPSGEAYKVGKKDPYLQVHRVFFRQTIDLGGGVVKLDPDLEQLAGTTTANRLVFTAGKFAVTDIFDNNKYAHDPRGDFLNWSIVDAGSFDYAADAWGFTAGAALEWYQGRWTLRGGAFLLSNVPNSPNIDTRFQQFQMIGEIEERHTLLGRPGKLLVTGFVTRGRMGRYDDAVRLAQGTGGPPSTADVRRYASRPGISVDLEQQLTGDLGLFARAGLADGTYETFEFTDIDGSVSGGLSLNGRRWGRPDDTVALAGAINQASKPLERYLAAGGLGVLVGDGRLPHPGLEQIIETYYDLSFTRFAHVALDYQFVDNPGYNRDRGPASIFAIRLHTQI